MAAKVQRFCGGDNRPAQFADEKAELEVSCDESAVLPLGWYSCAMDTTAVARDLVDALGKPGAAAYASDQIASFVIDGDWRTQRSPERRRLLLGAARSKAHWQEVAKKISALRSAEDRRLHPGRGGGRGATTWNARGEKVSVDAKQRAADLSLRVGDLIDDYGGSGAQQKIHSFSPHGVMLVTTRMYGAPVTPSKNPTITMPWSEAQQRATLFHRRGKGRKGNPAVPREVRLQAALLIPTRFSGRKELESLARQRDDVALAKLRQRLGFPGADQELVEAREAQINRDLYDKAHPFSGVEDTQTMDAKRLLTLSPKERLLWAHKNMGSSLASLVAPTELFERHEKRTERIHAARAMKDPLAARGPLQAERVIVNKRLREVVERADFRTASHSHDETFEVVPPGQEGASSRSDAMSASGMSAAYRKKARFITGSTHAWKASRAILSPEVKALNSAAPTGVVYLRPDLRVKQGRGTGLVVEHKTGARGAWS
jgi:hypothetical protein